MAANPINSTGARSVRATGNGVPEPSGIKIILADTQAIYRVGTKKIFALEDDIRVIAQCESLEQLLAACAKYPTADVVLMEHALCPVAGDAVSEMLKIAPASK